jgi:tubulin polyglutamylase TTLL6/13
MCFELLGFDIMMDSMLKPYLVEVNHAPAFATETEFDKELKEPLIRDSIKLLNLSNKRKN